MIIIFFLSICGFLLYFLLHPSSDPMLKKNSTADDVMDIYYDETEIYSDLKEPSFTINSNASGANSNV